VTQPFVLARIVEGHGEVEAIPILARRFVNRIGNERIVEIRRPTRVNRSRLLRPGELERHVELAAREVADVGGAILLLIDADDDCAARLGPELAARPRAARPDLPVAVVVAVREFEAWFLGAATSLRGRRGLPENLTPPVNAEEIRDAKGWLQDRREDGFAYSATTDQPVLAATMDLDAARAGAASFDKFCRELTRLLDETLLS